MTIPDTANIMIMRTRKHMDHRGRSRDHSRGVMALTRNTNGTTRAIHTMDSRTDMAITTADMAMLAHILRGVGGMGR